ncbi:MAG: hypothetical protein ACYCPF_16290 [Streptosporangiaceae bacterium]
MTINASLIAVLTDSERLLVAQTEPGELSALDEDAAVELHDRVRRARNKYAGQYRRTASERVRQAGGRGRARPENHRAAMKTEAFEEALSRVSRRVAVLARHSATDLRAERIHAARAARTGSGPAGAARPAGRSSGQATPTRRTSQGRLASAGSVADRSHRTPATAKRRAATRASGARRQAAKDSR